MLIRIHIQDTDSGVTLVNLTATRQQAKVILESVINQLGPPEVRVPPSEDEDADEDDTFSPVTNQVLCRAGHQAQVVAKVTYSDRDRVAAWLDAGHGDGLKLLPIHRVVLLELAVNMNGSTGLAWPGVDRLARRYGWSLKRIESAMTELGNLGLVETVERATGQRRARYRVSLPDEVAPHGRGARWWRGAVLDSGESLEPWQKRKRATLPPDAQVAEPVCICGHCAGQHNAAGCQAWVPGLGFDHGESEPGLCVRTR